MKIKISAKSLYQSYFIPYYWFKPRWTSIISLQMAFPFSWIPHRRIVRRSLIYLYGARLRIVLDGTPELKKITNVTVMSQWIVVISNNVVLTKSTTKIYLPLKVVLVYALWSWASICTTWNVATVAVTILKIIFSSKIPVYKNSVNNCAFKYSLIMK